MTVKPRLSLETRIDARTDSDDGDAVTQRFFMRDIRRAAALLLIVAVVGCGRLFSSDSSSSSSTGAGPADAAPPPVASTATAAPVVQCIKCNTQEEFDAARSRGQ